MTRTMDAATVDALLERAETAAATMVDNLVALDDNPSFTLVRHTTFDGVTAARHGRALADAPLLWERAMAFRATVTEARRLRGTDRRPDAAELAAAERLLTAPVVADPAAAPGTGLTGRTLFGSDAAPGVRLDDLAVALDTHYRAVAEAVRVIDALWQTLLPSLQALAARVDDAERRARDLAATPSDDLAARVRAALAAATTDPVGQTHAATALAAEVDALDARLDELAQRRARLDDEIAAARQELVALRRRPSTRCPRSSRASSSPACWAGSRSSRRRCASWRRV